jgi:hypothetical protein
VCVLKFSSFNKGANKGGLIIEQETVREHPIDHEHTLFYEEKMKTAIRYELELKVPLENTLTEKTEKF